MIVNRMIGGLELAIDINKASTIYVDEIIANKISNGALDQILEEIYNYNNSYLPLSMTWEITGKCNFKCPFCYINNENVTKIALRRFEIIKQDIDYLLEKGLLICYLTGGEVLTHPDFKEIYRYLKSKGVLVSVLTNLSLLSDDMVKLFNEFPPYKIGVSIYGLSNKTFKKITGHNYEICKKVLNNIIALKKNGINVICQTPINKFTVEEYTSIAKWCEINNIRYTCSNVLHPTYSGEINNKMKVDDELWNDLKKEVKRVNVTINKEKPNLRKEIGYKHHFDCQSGKFYFVLSHDYSIRPCFVYYDETAEKFNALNSLDNAMRDMIAYIEKMKKNRIPYCHGCEASDICNECVYTQNKQKNLKGYMEHKCNRNKELREEIITSIYK